MHTGPPVSRLALATALSPGPAASDLPLPGRMVLACPGAGQTTPISRDEGRSDPISEMPMRRAGSELISMAPRGVRGGQPSNSN